MITETAVIHRNPRVVHRALADGMGGVLLDLDTSRYFGINEVGVAIWELLESPLSLGSLVRRLAAQIDDPPAAMAGDVVAFVTLLKERGLVEVRDGLGHG